MRMIKYILPWFVLCGAAITEQGGQIRLEWYEHTPKTD